MGGCYFNSDIIFCRLILSPYVESTHTTDLIRNYKVFSVSYRIFIQFHKFPGRQIDPHNLSLLY